MCYLFGVLRDLKAAKVFYLRLSAFGSSTDPRYYAEDEVGVVVDGPIGHSVTFHEGRLHALSFNWVDELEERTINRSLKDASRSIDALDPTITMVWSRSIVERLARALRFAQHHLVCVSRMELDNSDIVSLSDGDDTCAWVGNALEHLPLATGKARLDELELPPWVHRMEGDDDNYFIKGLTRIPDLDGDRKART